jgi:demethylmenaquinone methyltransferase/2-methoxy-6-polyprenyl-1,4-benzoquinol methylase
VWKRYFVGTSGVKRGDRVLDLAGGTGDIAALLQPRVGEEGEVVLGDINAAMLGVGRDRLTDRGLVRGLRYVQLNAEALPFPDRQLRPGHHRLRPAQRHRQGAGAARDAPRAEGRRARAGAGVLAGAAGVVQADLRLPFLQGAAGAGRSCSPRIAASYKYLAESIRKHPAQETAAMMAEAGFERVQLPQPQRRHRRHPLRLFGLSRHGGLWLSIGLACSLVAATIVTILGVFVVPKFMHTYESFGAELPLATRLLARDYLFIWLAPIAVLAVGRAWPDRAGGNIVAGLIGVGSVIVFIIAAIFALYLPTLGLANGI